MCLSEGARTDRETVRERSDIRCYIQMCHMSHSLFSRCTHLQMCSFVKEVMYGKFNARIKNRMTVRDRSDVWWRIQMCCMSYLLFSRCTNCAKRKTVREGSDIWHIQIRPMTCLPQRMHELKKERRFVKEVICNGRFEYTECPIYSAVGAPLEIREIVRQARYMAYSNMTMRHVQT